MCLCLLRLSPPCSTFHDRRKNRHDTGKEKIEQETDQLKPGMLTYKGFHWKVFLFTLLRVSPMFAGFPVPPFLDVLKRTDSAAPPEHPDHQHKVKSQHQSKQIPDNSQHAPHYTGTIVVPHQWRPQRVVIGLASWRQKTSRVGTPKPKAITGFM